MNEIVRDLTIEETLELEGQFERGVSNLVEIISKLYQGRAWFARGYKDWYSYREDKLANIGMVAKAIDREERRELVAGLKENTDMSNRQIAATIGVHPSTVDKDIAGNPAPKSPTVTVEPPKITEGDKKTEIPVISWSDEETALKKQLLAGETVVVSYRSGDHKNLIDWASTQGLLVRIDRRSEFGNPFELPADGDRFTVIENYREHYLPYKPSIIAKLGDLKGKALACWCSPEPCHGDVLKEWAER